MLTSLLISTIIGAPLAGVLLETSLFGLHGWQELFILEALPALLFAVYFFFAVKDRPEQAGWLTDTEKACQALKRDGWICRLTDVIGVEITDEVGQLHKLLQAIEYSCINVDYLYLSFDRETAKPVIIFHTEDVPEMESSLEYQGYQVR